MIKMPWVGFCIATFLACASASWAKINVREEIGFDQKIGQQIPLDLTFTNEAGQKVLLKDYFGKRPVILNLVYFECPMLCTEVLNGLLRTLHVLKFNVGQEFNILTVSFDPRETSILAEKKSKLYHMRYERPVPDNSWPFLTGDEASIRKLANAVGFRYVYDASVNQYAHASGIVVLTPEGKVSRYQFGVEYSPNDLKLSLIDASQNKIGTAVDQILLYCYRYDPMTGKYGIRIMRTLRLSALLTLFGVAFYVTRMLRKERMA